MEQNFMLLLFFQKKAVHVLPKNVLLHYGMQVDDWSNSGAYTETKYVITA